MKLTIERSITINKPAVDVYNIISDLSQWNVWSPWIHMEPTAKTQITGSPQHLGQSQTWEGEVVGSGRMTLQQVEKNKLVNIKLEFLKPWKSLATVLLTLKEITPEQTSVIWKMDSSLPFFMFFFKKMMTVYLGSDFDRGLKMLKDYAELGAVPSRSIYLGEKSVSGFQWIGKKTTCAIADLSPAMKNDFHKLMDLMNKGELPPPLVALSFTHKFDLVRGICEYTAAYQYPLNQKIKTPIHYLQAIVPDHKAISVDHYGAYRHLGNPWGMMMGYQRCKKMKARKDIPMYEVYVSMPNGQPEKDLHTQLFLPLQ